MAGKGRSLGDSNRNTLGFTAKKQGADGEWKVMIGPHELEETLSE